ncbi:MAG: hypothetical protein IRY99_16285, partial [Isosphaeraceae bacterium]|nr:hypothetical protein [Isosphaeraceae bacterium]
MTPPPIRYPLPMLLVAIALALLIWRGERWTRPLRAVLAERWMRAVEGPPIPSSTEPKVVAGPIVRKVLLLRAPVPATDRPGGRVVETIRRRGLYDVYDLWPLQGRPTHDRIGNRRPIGWVAAEVVLPWDTRLVLRAPEGKLDLADQPERRAKSSVAVGAIPLPVVAWTDHAIEVAVWEADRPWSAIARRGWIASEEIPSEAWGVLLSSAECRALLDPP